MDIKLSQENALESLTYSTDCEKHVMRQLYLFVYCHKIKLCKLPLLVTHHEWLYYGLKLSTGKEKRNCKWKGDNKLFFCCSKQVYLICFRIRTMGSHTAMEACTTRKKPICFCLRTRIHINIFCAESLNWTLQFNWNISYHTYGHEI